MEHVVRGERREVGCVSRECGSIQVGGAFHRHWKSKVKGNGRARENLCKSVASLQ
jgi:hypothetical protein